MPHFVLVLVFAFASGATAEVIEKWRTPQGRLHFGDRPPVGSVLLERIEYAETKADDPVPDSSAREDALARAAADGREIIRRRAAERETQRLHRDEVLDYTFDAEPETTNIMVFSEPFRRFPHHGFPHHRRPHRHDRFDGHEPRFGPPQQRFADVRPGFGPPPVQFPPPGFRAAPPERASSRGGTFRSHRDGHGRRHGDRD